MTRWAKEVSPENALPEYPRPQMQRDDWMNLNGLWDYDLVTGEEAPVYERKILVPFPVESALSGIEEAVLPENTIHYRRTFSVPDSMKGQRILLHFGAVEWEAQVFVNGQKVGSHRGGYAPFHFDVTDALRGREGQEIHVVVKDPTDRGGQPMGKQFLHPKGIFYNAVSGIWGTVWIEGVPATHIGSLRMVPHVEDEMLTLDVDLKGDAAGVLVRASAMLDGKTVASEAVQPGATLCLSLADAKLWAPDSPTLYDLQVTLEKDGKTLDSVDSYFGMRELVVKKDVKGINRLYLNGKLLFQYGVLDQGYWPDGLYTAPTDEALRFDIEMTQQYGFNMIRKHIKTEPARWYAHCDRIGMLVWQDMPSRFPHLKSNGDNESTRSCFQEWGDIMDSLHNHPCIVMWVPFNEGWGQFDTGKVVAFVEERDPSRLINNASGWHDANVGDVRDVHKYPGPGTAPLEEDRAIVLGEYGGVGYIVEGHQWPDREWPGKPYPTRAAMRDAYDALLTKLRPLIRQSLAAAVYTGITDVESEANGFMTYDREVLKFDPKRMNHIHKELIGILKDPPPAPVGDPLRIMCIGDSITVGYTDNAAWTVPFKFGYRSRLYTLLKDAGYNFTFVGSSPQPWNNASGDPSHGGTYKPEFDLRDLGQDNHWGGHGARIPDVKEWLAADDPDVILLMIGINGISRQSPARIHSLVETIVTDKPDAHLVVAQITPYVNTKTEKNKLLYDYNVYIRDTLVPSFAAKGYNVSTVDMYSLFLTDPADYESAVAPGKHSNNYNHPFNEEYDRMADRWFAAIKALDLEKGPAAGGERALVPTAEQQPVRWRYTTEMSGKDWMMPDFDDAGWPMGPGGFGTEGTPNTMIGTTWDTSDIRLRTAFDYDGQTFEKAALRIHFDEDVEVYLNGSKVFSHKGFTQGYGLTDVTEAVRKALRKGKNLLAVTCHQTLGGQYIDVDLVLDPKGPMNLKVHGAAPPPKDKAKTYLRSEGCDKLPPLTPLIDVPLRDTSICIGGDGMYYLTGTTADHPGDSTDTNGWWYVNEGLRIWKSPDLKQWEPLGLVWSLDKDATWAREPRLDKNGDPRRSMWAPEIHYMKGTYWVTYTMNHFDHKFGCGLLKSTSGKAEGPYVDVKTDGPITPQLDASLFEDDDGTVYWVYQHGLMARMKDDMTGLAEKPRNLNPANHHYVGFEGAFLTKHKGKYYLVCADATEWYSCMVAEADNVYGPYGPRYLAIQHGGHNTFFTDKEGQWWATYFGHDKPAPLVQRPAIMKIELDENGRVRPVQEDQLNRSIK